MTTVLIGVATAASAQTQLPYGARTGHAEAIGRSPAIFEHGIEAGFPIEDTVEVLNYANAAATFEVYAVDMVRSSAGSPAPAARSSIPEGAGAWVRVDTPSVTIGAHESALVPLTVLAPEGTPPGEYGAALIVEPVVAVSPTGISSHTRIALPIELEVLGAINLGMDLGALTTDRSGGDIDVAITATNTGDVSFSADGSVVVVGWGGRSTAAVDLEPADVFIAPGDTVTLRGTWEDVPLLGRFTAEATIEATVGDRQPRSFASDPVTFWIIPWVLLLTILAIAVFGVVTWVRTAPSRHAWLEERRRERELVRDYRRERHLGA